MEETLDRTLTLRVGCEFAFDAPGRTPSIFLVRPCGSAPQRILRESWTAAPSIPYRDYVDLYANVCRRVRLPAGASTIRYDALVETVDALDPADPEARQLPIDDLPDDVLVYTLASRYCLSDVLSDRTWELFGATEPSWQRVQAIVDYVHQALAFGYGSSSPATTAVDALAAGRGVCRDFAHLAISFCRAMNVPARYAFGYLPDIEVAPPDSPMDFCAWFEAYLGGRWWTFDPRNNARRKGRVVIARGRDALDVAMVTSYGPVVLKSMSVCADAEER